MRLDVALVARGLVRSRNQAARLIADGQVLIDGAPASKPSQPVSEATRLDANIDPWVSRAAHKLLGALEDSGTPVNGRVLDGGASTGGFTQVCLERGAELVYAFDVGHDQLAPELGQDPRIIRRDGLNLRNLTLADVGGELVDLVVGDVSFISLTLLLEPLLAVLNPRGMALLLVKPQFEVGRTRLGSGGVVRDENLRQQAVSTVIEAAAQLGWRCDWQGISPVPGSDGNVEYFVRFTR